MTDKLSYSRRRLGLVDIAAIAVLYLGFFELAGRLQRSPDVIRYELQFDHPLSSLRWVSFDTPVDYVTHEWLWHWGVRKLMHDVGVPFEHIFLGISLISVVSFSLFVLRRHPPWALVLIANPLLYDLAFGQLRSALAFSVLLFAYEAKKRWAWVLLVPVACLIHTAMVMAASTALAIYYYLRHSEERSAGKTTRILILCGTGAALAILLGPLREQILSQVGDRRAEYVEASSSLAFLSYWILLFVLTLFQDIDFLRDAENSFAVVLLTLVAISPLTSGYSSRFLALGICFIMSAVLRYQSDGRLVALLIWLPYTFAQWNYRLENG